MRDSMYLGEHCVSMLGTKGIDLNRQDRRPGELACRAHLIITPWLDSLSSSPYYHLSPTLHIGALGERVIRGMERVNMKATSREGVSKKGGIK